MKDWKLAVKKQMKDIGISQEKLAEVIGCTQGAIGHWLNGRRKADIETINLILNAVKLPPLTIADEFSPLTYKQKINSLDVYDETSQLEDDEVAVPIIKEVELSAGFGRIPVTELKTDYVRFTKDMLIKMRVSFGKAVCVYVSGNSMEPFIKDGSLVGLDTGNTKIIDGKIYAVVIDNELARIKQLYRLPSNRVRLRSFNRDEYEDEEYSLDEIRVVGKVFWSSVLWD